MAFPKAVATITVEASTPRLQRQSVDKAKHPSYLEEKLFMPRAAPLQGKARFRKQPQLKSLELVSEAEYQAWQSEYTRKCGHPTVPIDRKIFDAIQATYDKMMKSKEEEYSALMPKLGYFIKKYGNVHFRFVCSCGRPDCAWS